MNMSALLLGGHSCKVSSTVGGGKTILQMINGCDLNVKLLGNITNDMTCL